MIDNYRARCWAILEPAEEGDWTSAFFDWAIIALILLNVLAVIVGSVQAVDAAYGAALQVFETVSVLVFTVEYLLRLWSCREDARYGDAIRGRLRFARSPMAIVDLFAIAPFFLAFIPIDLRFLRIFRLFRLLRVLKLGRYTTAATIFQNVLRAKREELVLTCAVMAMLIVVSACLIYFAEFEAQPEAFSDIPTAMWWSVVTLTTVGYGDVYPVTAFGRLFGAMIAIWGIGMVALPTGILGAGFVEEIERRKKSAAAGSNAVCPHCGKDLPS